MTTESLDRIAEACHGRIAPGTDDDAVCGIVPSFVVEPGSAAEVAAVLRVSADLGLAVVPTGTGSKLHWGAAPDRCDVLLDLSRLDRVVDHAAGDMVVEVEAGCRLDVLAETLGKAGQRLAVDPPRYDDDTRLAGTVGGLIATGFAGPLRHAYGSIRDLLLGVTMVRADGVIATSGGRVVKNVAGYDLGKLLCGSFGTLGVVTSAILRLHPVAEAVTWVAASGSTELAAEWVTALVDGQQLPATVDADRPGNGAPVAVSASFEGTAGGAAARARRAAAAMGRCGGEENGAASRSDDGDTADGDGATSAASAGDGDGAPDETGGSAPAVAPEEPTWHASLPGSPDGTLVEVAVPPALWAEAFDVVSDAAAASGLDVPMRAAAGTGIVHAAVAPDAAAKTVAAFVATVRGWALEHDGSAVLVHAPAAVLALGDPWGPVDAGALDLMRRVKDEFDPRHRLSPGRFVGRI